MTEIEIQKALIKTMNVDAKYEQQMKVAVKKKDIDAILQLIKKVCVAVQKVAELFVWLIDYFNE